MRVLRFMLNWDQEDGFRSYGLSSFNKYFHTLPGFTPIGSVAEAAPLAIASAESTKVSQTARVAAAGFY